MDSPGSVSVDICVSKCNGSQMVTCNQWFQCSESPECGGPCRLGDRCRRAECVFNFNSDYICSDDKCAVSCNTPQQCYVDFDSDKYHAWPQANSVSFVTSNGHRVSPHGKGGIVDNSNYVVNHQLHTLNNDVCRVIDNVDCGKGNKAQEGVGRVNKHCNDKYTSENNNFGQQNGCLYDNTLIAPRCTYTPSHINERVGFVQDYDNTVELPPL